MNAEKIEKLPPPPGVINSLRVGFDVVSSHVWLILLPILFDIVLWLGPRFSAGKIYSSFFASMLDVLKNRPLPEAETKAISDLFEAIGRVNWVSWVRTIPIGIPSLESFAIPRELNLQTPLGLQNVNQFESFLSLLAWTFLFTLIGWIAGSVYFRWVSVTTLGRGEADISVGRAAIQTFLLSLLWLVGMVIAFLPISLIVGAAGLFSPALSTAILFIIALLSYWLIVPLFFTPHGIFASRENALRSIYSSLRMTRFTFPSSGLFVFTLFILTRGLDFLWSVPTSDTWMKLVGIFGHAFISTTILSASFVFYRDMNIWLQSVLEQLQQKQNMPTQRA